MDIKKELLERYKYLYDNKELILANCIIYDIEKEKIKKLQKSAKTIKHSNDNDILSRLIKRALSTYKDDLTTPKPYLKSEPEADYISIIEELVLGDNTLTETRLYKYIESIKENNNQLNDYAQKIIDLEKRRSKNKLLKNVPTFTVWKIITYIKDKYPNNMIVLLALNKYYNLERYTLANDDCIYGYYIPEDREMNSYTYPKLTAYTSVNGDGISEDYEGNIFEKEDNYHDFILNDQLTDNYYPTQFANELAAIDIIEDKEKKVKALIKSTPKDSI